ncbi:hypothetical protein QTP88_009217 [Uroleucon formosanum]
MKPNLISPVTNMDMKKSMQNKPSDEMPIKLVVTTIIVSQSDSSRNTNVTPQAPTNIKYENISSIENSLDQYENHLNNFRQLNIKSLDNLLDNIFTKRQYHNGECPDENKYDVGANIILPRNNINGDYERSQKLIEIYLNNSAKARIKIDHISKTVNSLMKRKEVQYQTSNVTTRMTGTQVHNFNIVDTFDEIKVKQNLIPPSTINEESSDVETQHAILADKLQTDPMNDGAAEDYHPDTIMFWNRCWRKTCWTMNPLLGQKVFGFMYCFTLTLLGDTDKGLASSTVYSKLIYTDYTDKQYTSVAVWSTKNQHTPERFNEFNTSAITCLKFSIKTPNNLAIGFDCGKILIFDISKKYLNIVFQTSSKLSIKCLHNNGVQYNWLYFTLLFSHGKFQEKLIIKLYNSLIQEELPEKNFDESKKYKSVFHVTKFIELNQNADLVGTADGLVLSFLYDDLMTRPKKIVYHFGIIKSLEKSHFSQDVYLTTGCDCNINIWISDVFLEPVITLSAGKQIEKAIWSRTCSTIIDRDRRIFIWDTFSKWLI